MGFLQGIGFGGAPVQQPQGFTGFLSFGALASGAGTLLYYPPVMTSNASSIGTWRAPWPCILRNPTFWHQSPTGVDVRTYEVRVNGVATAWVLAVSSGAAGIQVGGLGDIPLAASDAVSIALISGGNLAQCRPTYQIEVWQDP